MRERSLVWVCAEVKSMFKNAQAACMKIFLKELPVPSINWELFQSMESTSGGERFRLDKKTVNAHVCASEGTGQIVYKKPTALLAFSARKEST